MSARRGVVWIAPAAAVPRGRMIDPRSPVFEALWQYLPDDASANAPQLLDAVGDVDAQTAVDWGRARASVVYIRLNHDSDGYFTAGEIERSLMGRPIRSWPPKRPVDGWWTPSRDDVF